MAALASGVLLVLETSPEARLLAADTGPPDPRRLVASVPWRLLLAVASGVLLVLATSPDARVPADTRARSPEPCRLLVASVVARCQLVPT